MISCKWHPRAGKKQKMTLMVYGFVCVQLIFALVSAYLKVVKDCFLRFNALEGYKLMYKNASRLYLLRQ